MTPDQTGDRNDPLDQLASMKERGKEPTNKVAMPVSTMNKLTLTTDSPSGDSGDPRRISHRFGWLMPRFRCRARS